MDHPQTMAELTKIIEGCKLTSDEIRTLPDYQIIGAVQISTLFVVFPHEAQGIQLNKLLAALNAVGTVDMLNLHAHPGCDLELSGVMDGFR